MCPVAKAVDDLLPGNYEVFDIFMADLGSAIVNLAPMSSEPMFGLDAGWVRLALEARGYHVRQWPEMIRRLQILHRAREASRK